MDLLNELEAVRTRILQEINTEFDLLLERAVSEGATINEPVPIKEYEVAYPLTAGTALFKGTKPTNVVFPDGSRHHVSTWKQVTKEIMLHCLSDPQNKKRLMALSGNISGRKRLLLAKTNDNMRSPLELSSDLYMETHYDTETLLNVLTTRILGAIQYDYSGIQITIRNS